MIFVSCDNGIIVYFAHIINGVFLRSNGICYCYNKFKKMNQNK